MELKAKPSATVTSTYSIPYRKGCQVAAKKEPSIFGKRLKVIRRVRGLTQEELESKSGVSSAMISHFETGERQKASADNLVKLAEALNVSIDYLLGRSDELEMRGEKIEAVFRRLSEATDKEIDQSLRLLEAMLGEGPDEK